MTATDVLCRPTLLLVDDHAPTRHLLHTTLGDEAYRIAEAGDGREALRIATLIRPAVVVLDLDLGTPELDGLDVCRAIRARPELDEVQIILVTGHDTDSIRARAS